MDQKTIDDIIARLKKVEYLFAQIRLPTSWYFTLPAFFKQLTYESLIGPLINKADAGDQFVMVHGSGAPTGTPKTKGAMYWDYTNNKLYGWNGSAWKSATFS